METKKLNEFEIEITKDAPIIEKIVTKYERTFIENQIVEIQKSKDVFNDLRDAELAECQTILSEMDKLMIINKPIEIQKEIISEELIK